MKRNYEYKKHQSKCLWNIKAKNIQVQDSFGGHSVKFHDFVDCVSGVVGQPVTFVVAFDKAQEDWDFTEEMCRYFMEQMTVIMTDEYTNEHDLEWKADYKKFLKAQLEAIG